MGVLYRRKKKIGVNADGNPVFRELPTWWIKFYQSGRAVRESTETTKETVARRKLRAREGDVEHGIPIDPKMGKITFDDAADDFLTDYETNKKKSYQDTKRRVDLHLTPFFRGRRLMAINTALIRQYIAARAGFFEAEAFRAVRDRLPAALQPVVAFAYLTDWRLTSEILPLEWRQVDWTGRFVRLDPGTTKSGEGRSYPFTAALEQLLRTQLADHELLNKKGTIVPLVFHREGERIKTFRKALRTACQGAGVPGRLLHDFRRTAVRNLELSGVSRSAAMAMVGHKTESIYRRYAIVDAGTLRAAAAKIDSAMGTLSGTPASKSMTAAVGRTP